MADHIEIEATIEQAASYIGRDAAAVRVHARYESAGTIGNLTMDFPVAFASELYVGRTLLIQARLAAASPAPPADRSEQ